MAAVNTPFGDPLKNSTSPITTITTAMKIPTTAVAMAAFRTERPQVISDAARHLPPSKGKAGIKRLNTKGIKFKKKALSMSCPMKILSPSMAVDGLQS